MWFVLDAETVDPLFPSMAAVVRQELTIEEAVAGLLAEHDPGFYDQAAEGEVEAADLGVELDDELADAIIDEYERTYGEGNFPTFDGAGDEIGGRL